MTTTSFLPKLDYASEATDLFRYACELILSDKTPEADEVIRSIDSDRLARHYDAVCAEWTPRHEKAISPLPSSTEERTRERMPPRSVEYQVYERDHWHCRWCNTRTLDKRANKRMNLVFPRMYGNGPKNIEFHGLIMCTQASLDHVVPHSLGGTNEIDNLVTACWPCQFARGNDDFTRLGLSDPRDRPPVADPWDGCSWFRA